MVCAQIRENRERRGSCTVALPSLYLLYLSLSLFLSLPFFHTVRYLSRLVPRNLPAQISSAA